MFKRLFCIAALVLTASVGHAQQVAIDDSFATNNFNWSSGGGALIRWRPVASGGKILFCGAYANISHRNVTVRFNREVMRKARIMKGDSVVIQNATFFNIVNSSHRSEGLVGQMANCRDTGVTGTDLNGFKVDYYDGRYRVRK